MNPDEFIDAFDEDNDFSGGDPDDVDAFEEDMSWLQAADFDDDPSVPDCPICGGTGWDIDAPCDYCDGEGYLWWQ